MGWIQVMMAGLTVTTIGLGIWHLLPVADHYYSSLELEEPGCFPALFSFGSSVADTGTQAISLPFQRTENSPYGSTFFGKPSKRYSDGRLHIDFWASTLKIPFLDPYLKSVGSNFRRGVNFAASGATATNDTAFSPFTLSVQLNQFREFKRDVLALTSKGSATSSKNGCYDKLPREEYFRDGLYVIAIGGNDFLRWFLGYQLLPREVESLAPEVSQAILQVVETLYAEGARNILVEDLFPSGCLPIYLSNFASDYSDQLDATGCLQPFNAVVQLYNSLLKQGLAELCSRLPNASFAVVETYSIRYDILANHEKYGFEVPLKACCGSGGDYNFRSDCPCGSSIMVDGVMITAEMCDNVSRYAMWDGIHFTDAFNRAVMKGILSGNHFEPSFDLTRNGCFLAEI